MALPSASVIREHVRHVYRQAAALSITASVYLDQLADLALEAERDGKTLLSAGSGRTTTAFQVFQSFKPADVLELIDVLRDPCSAASADSALEALANLAVGVRNYRTDYSGVISR